jgi:hypothetical protein
MPEDGTARCYSFARQYGVLLEDNPGAMTVTLFCNEGDFHLDGYSNEQKCPIWASECPQLTVTNPMNPERVLVQQTNFPHV